MDITKQVVVMMPFSGNKGAPGRRCLLDFLRIKYLVEEKMQVTARGNGSRVRYRVDACNLQVGHIPSMIVGRIAEADILIGLLTEANVNVIYELALRNLLKDEMILVVKGDADKVVPIYLQEMARIAYTDGDNGRVGERIEKIAEDSERDVHFQRSIPDDLRKAIDDDDATLESRLQDALQTIETAPPPRPEHIRDLVKYLGPGNILSGWVTYYPYSVVRIKWSKMSAGDAYLPEDMDGHPVICSGNPELLSLFNYAGNGGLPSPDSDQALTLGGVIERLKHRNLVSGADLDDFHAEQNQLQEDIILGNAPGRATVPLRFNNRHTEAYRGKSFLPCLLGRRTVGDTSKPHTTYLLTAFVEITDKPVSESLRRAA
jgi:hypothetical protein